MERIVKGGVAGLVLCVDVQHLQLSRGQGVRSVFKEVLEGCFPLRRRQNSGPVAKKKKLFVWILRLKFNYSSFVFNIMPQRLGRLAKEAPR